MKRFKNDNMHHGIGPGPLQLVYFEQYEHHSMCNKTWGKSPSLVTLLQIQRAVREEHQRGG